MPYTVEYFHERVLNEVQSWPVDVLADCARIIELLMKHGPICECRILALSVTVCSS